tara:strand:- start:17 stop:430 length:414 start_codon:yes stop_codon:yes gene_type:complete
MLPVLVILAMALVQVGLVARTTVLVHHAAREGARDAAVGGSMREVEDAVIGSSGLLLPDTEVERVVAGDRVTVTVRHLARTDTPLIGPILPDVVLSATVSMRRERRVQPTVVYRWGRPGVYGGCGRQGAARRPPLST